MKYAAFKAVLDRSYGSMKDIKKAEKLRAQFVYDDRNENFKCRYFTPSNKLLVRNLNFEGKINR